MALHRTPLSGRRLWLALHRMTTTEFVIYYSIAVVAIGLLTALVRFRQLKPLFSARKFSALVEQNQHSAGQLNQIGIKIEGQGPLHWIAPPPYVPDALLVVGAELEVWVSDQLPGDVLTTEPSFSTLLAKSFKPALVVAFGLFIPVFFILRGRFGAV